MPLQIGRSGVRDCARSKKKFDDLTAANNTTAPGRVDWSSDENRFIVQVYFDMLQKEQLGESYRKVDYNRRVQQFAGRSKGSVEFKFQNISSWLEDMNMPRIAGYKPAANRQQSLKVAIETYLQNL